MNLVARVSSDFWTKQMNFVKTLHDKELIHNEKKATLVSVSMRDYPIRHEAFHIYELYFHKNKQSDMNWSIIRSSNEA